MARNPIKILSAPEQVADYLRQEIAHGRLQGNMPGINWLTSELGIHRTTTVEALRILEHEGLIVSQGAGKPRKIAPLTKLTKRGLRVALLLYHPSDIAENRTNELRHQLGIARHNVIVAPKTLAELSNDLARLEKMVKKMHADAWVVIGGSREILKWFADADIPCFALFGNSIGIPVPTVGPSTGKLLIEVTQKLLKLNHRRICLLMSSVHRGEGEEDSPVIRAYKETLSANGIPASDYNAPYWQCTPESLQGTLNALFQLTPPTALIIDDREHVLSVMQFLAIKGIKPVKDVSLFCLDADSSFSWTDPVISHTDTDERPWIRRVVQWADNTAMGKKDIKKSSTKPRIIEGGTIGPAPKA
ncbi:MAG: substrate-binding domain-containing protein [Verrucomicrobiae bacterium]|nr:substrate-binding domain-containing protein [Verrucomicrobiae bacterium]NNJ43311.1 substrate-binding domain-containing protein [Akkermansiaceae bacterium]